MARVSAKHNRVLALRVALEHRLPALRNRNGPAPAVREPHSVQRRVQSLHPMLEMREYLGSFPDCNVQRIQAAPIFKEDQSSAKYHRLTEEPSPQIREID